MRRSDFRAAAGVRSRSLIHRTRLITSNCTFCISADSADSLEIESADRTARTAAGGTAVWRLSARRPPRPADAVHSFRHRFCPDEVAGRALPSPALPVATVSLLGAYHPTISIWNPAAGDGRRNIHCFAIKRRCLALMHAGGAAGEKQLREVIAEDFSSCGDGGLSERITGDGLRHLGCAVATEASA